jgi:ribosomal protein S18 acetylase RimI-like enzyme
VKVRRATAKDMPAVAAIHRAAFNSALPHLADRHSPAEDLMFFTEKVLPTTSIWLVAPDEIEGFIAFRQGWIDHLYVAPASQHRGLGSLLLAIAKEREPTLELWTFQCNRPARSFYEKRGFRLVEETDGARNEEREPDARYRWDGV